MNQPVALSKAKLLNLVQCPRRLWLEQYNPELEDPSDAMNDILDGELHISSIAKASYPTDGALQINSRSGLRSAIEQTSTALKDSPTRLIFDATFEYDGVQTQVAILDWRTEQRCIYQFHLSDEIRDEFLFEAAIAKWILAAQGYLDYRIYLALRNSANRVAENATFAEIFALSDVTDRVTPIVAKVAEKAAQARAILASLEEPMNDIGTQCQQRYECPFLEHCRN